MKSPAPPTHVIILAQANLTRLAWSALLDGQPGLEYLGGGDGQAGLPATPETVGPVVLLLDYPRIDPATIRSLAGTQPAAGLLALGVVVELDDLDDLIALLRAGATGVLSRDASVPELVSALVAAGRGEVVLPPALAARALAALVRSEPRAERPAETLTAREREVLALLSRGLTNKQIAQTLFLSVRTVEAHLRHIYDKLNVTSRTEAVLWAVQHDFEA